MKNLNTATIKSDIFLKWLTSGRHIKVRQGSYLNLLLEMKIASPQVHFKDHTYGNLYWKLRNDRSSHWTHYLKNWDFTDIKINFSHFIESSSMKRSLVLLLSKFVKNTIILIFQFYYLLFYFPVSLHFISFFYLSIYLFILLISN